MMDAALVAALLCWRSLITDCGDVSLCCKDQQKIMPVTRPEPQIMTLVEALKRETNIAPHSDINKLIERILASANPDGLASASSA